MYWLRRSLLVPLGLLLFLTLFAFVGLLQANSTILHSAYYVDAARETNLYAFVMNDVVSTAIEETLEVDGAFLPEVIDGSPLNALGLTNDQVTASVNTAFPTEWVQANAEPALLGVGGYITGEHDEFEFSITPAERSEAMASEIGSLINESNLYALTFEGILAPAIASMVVATLPVELDVTQGELEDYVANVFPEEWAEAQVTSVVDELTEYLFGNDDGFEVSLILADRIEVAMQELKGLLEQSDAYDKLYLALVEPIVMDSFGGTIRLPYGITLEQEEIVLAMHEVAPPSWIQAQAEQIIDDATPYLTGEVDSFSTEISLVDNKRAAIDAIEVTAGLKLRDYLETLPACTSDTSLNDLISQGFGQSLTCVPANTPRDFVAATLGSVVANSVEESILNSVPDAVSFTERDLEVTLVQAGVEDGNGVLSALRSSAQSGWTYNDEDLENTVRNLFLDETEGEEAVESLNSYREVLSEGWTYTDEDLKENLSEGSSLSALGSSRSDFKLYRIMGPLLVIPVLLLMVVIGFVASDVWRWRFVWAFGALAAASLLTLIVMFLFYNAMVDAQIDTVQSNITARLVNVGSLMESKRMALDKVFEIVDMASDDFSSGVKAKSFIILLISISAMGIALGWNYLAPYVQRLNLQRLNPRTRH